MRVSVSVVQEKANGLMGILISFAPLDFGWFSFGLDLPVGLVLLCLCLEVSLG